jgi:peptidoglycan hydrolase FlgJ
MELLPANGLPVTLSRTPAAPAPKDLRAAAEGFESLFLTELLKGGRASLPGDDLTSSQGVSMATDMLDTHLAQHAAGHSRLGVADAIMRQFGGALAKP